MHKQEQANLLYTNGTITRKWEVPWDKVPVYKIAYTFGEREETQQVVTKDFFTQANVGDTIRVRYLSYDPSVSTAVYHQ